MSRSNAKAAAERLKNQSSDVVKDTQEPAVNQEPAKVNDNELEALNPAEEGHAESENETSSIENIDITKDDENLRPSDEQLAQVEFIGPYKRYSKGDIAAFSPEVAKDLIDKKVAVLPGKHTETEQEPV